MPRGSRQLVSRERWSYNLIRSVSPGSVDAMQKELPYHHHHLRGVSGLRSLQLTSVQLRHVISQRKQCYMTWLHFNQASDVTTCARGRVDTGRRGVTHFATSMQPIRRFSMTWEWLALLEKIANTFCKAPRVVKTWQISPFKVLPRGEKPPGGERSVVHGYMCMQPFTDDTCENLRAENWSAKKCVPFFYSWISIKTHRTENNVVFSNFHRKLKYLSN